MLKDSRFSRRAIVLLLALSAAGAARFAAAQENISPRRLAIGVGGQRFAARPVGVDEDWNFRFETDMDEKQVPASRLVSWGVRKAPKSAMEIILADGGVVAAEEVRIAGDDLWFESYLWGRSKLPTTIVRGVIFRPPAVPMKHDRLVDRILSSTGEADQLLLENGDVLSGVLQSSKIEEDASPLTPQSLPLELNGVKVDVPHEKTIALILNPALVAAPLPEKSHCLLGFREGDFLAVNSIKSANGKLQLLLPGGGVLRAFPQSLWEELTLLRPMGAGVGYLSEIKPLGYKHVPFLERKWPYGVDRNVLGGLLRKGGDIYSKGLAMHSASRLAYQLDGRYRRFEAEAAIDDAAGGKGSVVFRVYLDRGAGQWKAAYESPVIRGGDRLAPISVDLQNAKRMALLIDYADRGDEWDHADWLNARLIK